MTPDEARDFDEGWDRYKDGPSQFEQRPVLPCVWPLETEDEWLCGDPAVGIVQDLHRHRSAYTCVHHRHAITGWVAEVGTPLFREFASREAS